MLLEEGMVVPQEQKKFIKRKDLRTMSGDCEDGGCCYSWLQLFASITFVRNIHALIVQGISRPQRILQASTQYFIARGKRMNNQDFKSKHSLLRGRNPYKCWL